MSSTAKGTPQDVESCAGDGLLLPLLYEGLSEFLDTALECFDTQQEARGRELLVRARLIALQLLLNLDQCGNADDLGAVLRCLADS